MGYAVIAQGIYVFIYVFFFSFFLIQYSRAGSMYAYDAFNVLYLEFSYA